MSSKKLIGFIGTSDVDRVHAEVKTVERDSRKIIVVDDYGTVESTKEVFEKLANAFEDSAKILNDLSIAMKTNRANNKANNRFKRNKYKINKFF